MSAKPFYELINHEMIQLCTPDSRSFSVHKAVLESRCKVIYSALSTGFSESKEGAYTCTDTTYETLGRVVEWMYTGRYFPAMIIGIKPRTGQPPEIEQGIKSTNLGELAEEMKGEPIMAHLQLNIFCDLYLITELKDLVSGRLKCDLTIMERAERVETQGDTIIAMLHLAFSKIKTGDELLEWLAHFASWTLDNLLSHSFFGDLLLEIPALGGLMMTFLPPATSSPWGSRRGKKPRLNQASS